MGKIVKYCGSCDEGFAERFGFCPDCGAPLQAFEMNPVDNEAGLAGEPEENSVFAAPAPVDNEIDATPIAFEPEVPAPSFLQADEEIAYEADEADQPEEEEDTAWAAAPAPVLYQTSAMNADEPSSTIDDSAGWDYSHADDGYYITVIQEKNTKQRNILLLGATALVLVTVVTGWGISLFQKSLDVGAIGSDTSLAYLGVDVPMEVEDKPEPEKANDKDGGGGGGGKKQPDPVNQGDIPNQTKNPLRPPDPNVHRSDNFELKMPPPSTEGNKKFEKKYGQWGDPTSTYGKLSSGPGSGGGMGTGNGPGVGSGTGTGTGSGSGSGYGSGTGRGNGDGDGDGGGAPPAPVIPKVTTAMRIISRPRANYTDAARTNAVTGSVRLKVTLLASGEVGGITPLTRLPHGLTEQAIAAARQIKFEPKKVNGVPISVSVTFDYSFTIY